MLLHDVKLHVPPPLTPPQDYRDTFLVVTKPSLRSYVKATELAFIPCCRIEREINELVYRIYHGTLSPPTPCPSLARAT